MEVKGDKVYLTALQLCARDIEVFFGDLVKLPMAELETQYEAKFGREMPLTESKPSGSLGSDSVSKMLIAMNDTLSVRGIQVRRMELLMQLFIFIGRL